MAELVETDERFTPEHVLEVVRQFAPIYLDPCTTADNPTRAEHWITAEQDALGDGQGWYRGDRRRFIFVNPPYSRGELVRWMSKCVEESQEAEIVALIPSDLGTEAGRIVATSCDALCFVHGRLTFRSPAGKPSAGAKQPSVMPYWGEDTKRFERVFSQLGTVWVR